MNRCTEPQILRIDNITKYFYSKSGFIRKKTDVKKAVDGVSFSVTRGEALGIVGESGSGKSTLAKIILRLIPPTSGSIYYKNNNISDIPESKFRKYRMGMQMIFQDPYASLNPRMTVFDILAEPLMLYKITPRDNLMKEVSGLMETVGLSPSLVKKYPHEFSGGQRQRIAIARALSVRPELLIADEPLSALDVSVQAQILNLISSLKEQLNLTMIFISHNLAVVKHVCTNVAVMNSGRIVEYGDVPTVFTTPSHPFTRTLLDSVPELES